MRNPWETLACQPNSPVICEIESTSSLPFLKSISPEDVCTTCQDTSSAGLDVNRTVLLLQSSSFFHPPSPLSQPPTPPPTPPPTALLSHSTFSKLVHHPPPSTSTTINSNAPPKQPVLSFCRRSSRTTHSCLDRH